MLLLPSVLIPILHPSYRRSCELTCDMHGLACMDDTKDAAKSLSIISAGKTLWNKVDQEEFGSQCKNSTGFWMTFHELRSNYPWTTKRVHMINTLVKEQKVPTFPRRNFFGWVAAIFVPNIQMIALIYISLIFFATTLHNIVDTKDTDQEYLDKKTVEMTIESGFSAFNSIHKYSQKNEVPENVDSIVNFDKLFGNSAQSIRVVDNTVVLTLKSKNQFIDGKTVIYYLSRDEAEGKYYIECNEGTLDNAYRPEICKI